MLDMKNRKKNELFQLISNDLEMRKRVLKVFWDRVIREPNGCWVRGKCGDYGMFTYKVDDKKYLYVSSHRFSLMLHTGRDEVNLDACHSCDNPPCIRPDHLFWGTHKQNMIDRGIKAREASRKLSIKEDTVVRACQAYEENLELGKYKAMRSALQLMLDEVFQGDPDKTYRQEIRNLKSEISKLREEVLR